MSVLPAGPIVPLVTPFDRTGERLDLAALRRLVNHLLERGATGLCCTALTGEGPLLDAEETERVWTVVAETVEAAETPVPVLGAIISTRTASAVALASRAERLGLTALLTAPILPELYARRSVTDLARFHAAIADATALPQVLFNYPSLTGVDLTPQVIDRLVGIPGIIAIKESSGDSRRVHALHRRFADRLEVICGAPDTALESLALGTRTWITGITNVVPAAAAQLMATVATGDLPAARRIYHSQILPLVDIMRGSSNPTGTIKAGLRLTGCPVGRPRAPGSPLAGPPLRTLKTFVTDARCLRPIGGGRCGCGRTGCRGRTDA